MNGVTQTEMQDFLVRLRHFADSSNGSTTIIPEQWQELQSLAGRMAVVACSDEKNVVFGTIRLKITHPRVCFCSEAVRKWFALDEADKVTPDVLMSRVWSVDVESFRRMLAHDESAMAGGLQEIRLLLPDHQCYYLSCLLVCRAPGEWDIQIRDVTELRRNAMLMDIQHELALAVNAASSLEVLAEKMLQVGVRVDGMNVGAVLFRKSPDSDEFTMMAQYGCSAETVNHYNNIKPLNMDYFSRVCQMRDGPVFFGSEWSAARTADGYANYNAITSISYIPIIQDGVLRGTVALASSIFKEIPSFVRNLVELINADIGAVVARLTAEQALRQSEENYRLLVENQSELIVKIGLDGRIWFANKACCEFFRKSAGSICGRRLTALLHWRDLVKILRQIDSLRKEPYHMAFEQQLNGESRDRWVAWRCNAIVEHGRITAYLGIGRDITANKKSENMLLQSEHRLRLILRAVSDCTWDWNLDNNELTGDHKLYELLGYSPDEIKITIFDIIRNFVHIEDRRRVEHDIRELIENQSEAFDGSFRMRRRDGSYFWVLMRAIVVKGGGNDPLRVVGCLEDITDRRDYDRMKESYTFLQKMLDALPLPVFFKDVNGKYLGFNKAMSRGFESFRTETTIGCRAVDLWGGLKPDLVEKIEFEEKKLLKEGGHSSYVLQVTGDDGYSRELVIHKSLVFASNGTPECMVGAVIDVTDLKKTEHALKVASQRLNTILNVMHEIIIWFDADMRVVWANRAAYETFGGITGRDITGMHCRDIWLQRSSGNGGGVADDDFRIGKDGGKEVFRLSDGRFFETWFYPVGTNSEESGWIQLALDVSEQEKARDEARMKQEQLIQADKMTSLGILVSGVAHEINNPNNFIVINVSILKKAWENILKLLDEYAEEKGEFNVAGVPYSKFSSMVTDLLAGIDEGAERIRVIVNDLKDYVRQTPTDLKGSFNVNDALSRAFTLCRNMIKRATNNYKIIYGNDLPLVKGDVYRLEQVIINIVQNACHALKSKESAITVTTSCSDGREVVIEVVDEGVGISPDNLKHITDPFFTTKRDIGGTGLGLAISSSIVEEHNGRLQIESVLGEGTTVRICLPVAADSGGTGNNEPLVGTTALNSKRQDGV